MSDYPKRVTINEVGPREGFQFEKIFIPTEKKTQLVDALSDTGVTGIEVTSFVSPKWVPQMADADDLSARFKKVPGVKYTALYLNQKGLERAASMGVYELKGSFSLFASEQFTLKNTNKPIKETLDSLGEWIKTYEQLKIPAVGCGIGAAFGCNYEGDIRPERVINLASEVEKILQNHGYQFKMLSLADTMGWANPRQIHILVGKIRERWPDIHIRLHLHDTRGPGLANVHAALEMGISDFDASVGGLGGCPFAGHSAAAGNICTEDTVFMLQEMGIETGIDLEKLSECARLAESIVGHELPGKVMKAGGVAKYRNA